jgi:hypothetical protein
MHLAGMFQAGISQPYIYYRHVSLAGVYLTDVHLCFILIEEATRPTGVWHGVGGVQGAFKWYRPNAAGVGGTKLRNSLPPKSNAAFNLPYLLALSKFHIRSF